MKVFISQPMSSRTDEEIFEMRDEIKRIVMSPILKNRFGYDESEVEFLSTYDDEFNTNLTEEDFKERHKSIFLLGHALQLLSETDLVIFAPDFKTSRGCTIEKKICDLYHIPFYIMPNKKE